MKIIPPVELRFQCVIDHLNPHWFLASHDVNVICPELCCVEHIMDLGAASVC
jgi:hypothetical protein